MIERLSLYSAREIRKLNFIAFETQCSDSVSADRSFTVRRKYFSTDLRGNHSWAGAEEWGDLTTDIWRREDLIEVDLIVNSV
jgi:hypothetical protein